MIYLHTLTLLRPNTIHTIFSSYHPFCRHNTGKFQLCSFHRVKVLLKWTILLNLDGTKTKLKMLQCECRVRVCLCMLCGGRGERRQKPLCMNFTPKGNHMDN